MATISFGKHATIESFLNDQMAFMQRTAKTHLIFEVTLSSQPMAKLSGSASFVISKYSSMVAIPNPQQVQAGLVLF